MFSWSFSRRKCPHIYCLDTFKDTQSSYIFITVIDYSFTDSETIRDVVRFDWSCFGDGGYRAETGHQHTSRDERC